MTPQEQEMIRGLIDRVQQTKLPEKDVDAEQLLGGSLGHNPDALYILAQTVLVQKYALDQAQKQIADLKSQLDQARQQQPHQSTSFLGSLFGHSDPAPPPPPIAPQANRLPATPQYAPVQGYAPPPGYAPAPQQMGAQSFGAPQGGGFLRGAMQTAAGVAAGALAFEGIESLMHGFGGGGGGFGGAQGLGGFGGQGGFGSGAPREEIINNYYGDSGGSGLSTDVEDRRGDGGDASGQLADSGSSDFANDDSGTSIDSGNGGGDSLFGSGDSDVSDTDSSFDSGGDSSFDSGGDSSFDSGGGDDSSFS